MILNLVKGYILTSRSPYQKVGRQAWSDVPRNQHIHRLVAAIASRPRHRSVFWLESAKPDLAGSKVRRLEPSPFPAARVRRPYSHDLLYSTKKSYSLRGPAPLQHALLQGREHTGITLQTLHPEHFDLGEIVAQRQFQIQRPNKCTLHDLYDQASTVAAQALVESIVSGSYLDHTPQPSISDANVTHARKLTPEVAHVDWETWPIDRVLRTGRVFGHVWCYFDSKKHGEVRVQMHGLQQCYAPVGDEAHSRGVSKVINGAATNGDSHQSPNMRLKISGDIVTVATCDGNLVSCDTVTAEGRPKHEDAVDFFTALGQDRV